MQNPTTYIRRDITGYERPLLTYRREPTVVQHREASITHRKGVADYSGSKPFSRRPMLCLLIAAHNEELVLEKTLRSAMHAGMQRQHIYVVDDNSTDRTSAIARSVLGSANVIKVGRSGKGLALTKAAKHFQLTRRYRWIHIADADGAFAKDYFTVFRRSLRVRYAAATGYIKSLPGGPVSQYRVFDYTIGLEIYRRFQAMTNTITVIPGPTSCFRADVFSKLNFANDSLTEDFDATLQLHRKRLGRIQYIMDAVAYTQDPMTVSDFYKQITRWFRGLMQGVRDHRIGRKATRVDAYMSYQLIQNFTFFSTYFIFVPLVALLQSDPAIIAATFLYDVSVTGLLTMAVAAYTKRWDILGAFPFIFILRWVTMFVFLKAFVEVTLLGRFKGKGGAWTSVQRYEQPVAA